MGFRLRDFLGLILAMASCLEYPLQKVPRKSSICLWPQAGAATRVDGTESVCTGASTCPPGHPGSRLAVQPTSCWPPLRPQVLSGKPCTLPAISVDHFGSSLKTQLTSHLSHEAFQDFFPCHFPPQQDESVFWVFRALYVTLGQSTCPHARSCVSPERRRKRTVGMETM